MDLTTPPLTILVDPDCELGRALQHIDASPIVLECGSGRFGVTRAGDDLWDSYDPERFRAGLRAMAGTLTPEEGERLKSLIYRGREAGSRPTDCS